jgi:anti-sigma regulatory factor (Ser/Thr protein kinase)
MTPQVYTVELPGTPDQVRVIRRTLTDKLGLHHLCLDDTVLLASEAGTNVVKHTKSGTPGGHFTFTVEWTSNWARVTLGDQGSPTVPCHRTTGPEDTTGRGIHLIDQLSSRWGFTRDASGTRVFFDVTALR